MMRLLWCGRMWASRSAAADVAIESAGIILVQSNPLDIVKIFHSAVPATEK